jgi:hypothetical protein
VPVEGFDDRHVGDRWKAGDLVDAAAVTAGLWTLHVDHYVDPVLPFDEPIVGGGRTAGAGDTRDHRTGGRADQ